MTQAHPYAGPTDPGLVKQVAAFPGAEAVESCMQCGVCSGSCTMAHAMPESPRRLMAHLLAGDRDRVLSSESIWYCTSCYTCAVRCPQGINVTDVMMALRSLALDLTRNSSANFYRTFTGHVLKYGRVWEAGVALTAGLGGGVSGLLKNAPLGIGLVRRGRLGFLPHKISGAAQVAALARAAASRSPRIRREEKV